MGFRGNSHCLWDEDLIKLVTRNLKPSDKKRIIDHLLACSFCRRKFLSLLDLQHYLNSRFAADKSLFSSIEFGEVKEKARFEIQKLEKQRKPSSPEAKRRPVSFRWGVGVAIFIIFLAGVWWLFWPRQPQPAYRSSSSDSIVILTPAGKIAAPPEEFRWQSFAGAKAYKFELIDKTLKIIYSQKTFSSSLILPAPIRAELQRNTTYAWSVEALDADEQKLATASATFQIK